MKITRKVQLNIDFIKIVEIVLNIEDYPQFIKFYTDICIVALHNKEIIADCAMKFGPIVEKYRSNISAQFSINGKFFELQFADNAREPGSYQATMHCLIEQIKRECNDIAEIKDINGIINVKSDSFRVFRLFDVKWKIVNCGDNKTEIELECNCIFRSFIYQGLLHTVVNFLVDDLIQSFVSRVNDL